MCTRIYTVYVCMTLCGFFIGVTQGAKSWNSLQAYVYVCLCVHVHVCVCACVQCVVYHIIMGIEVTCKEVLLVHNIVL